MCLVKDGGINIMTKASLVDYIAEKADLTKADAARALDAMLEGVEKGLKDRFETLDAIAQLNQIKVLNAMQKHQIAEMHLGGTTGYGYNDSGREAVEALYADVYLQTYVREMRFLQFQENHMIH